MLTDPIVWQARDTLPVLLLGIPILFFPISYYVPRLFRPALERRGASPRQRQVWAVIGERLFGAAILGLPAVGVVAAWRAPMPPYYGFNFQHAGLSLAAATVSIAIVWGVLRNTAGVWPAGFKGYPQMRVRCWDRRLVTVNTASWIVYLVVHEFLFRSALLYPLAAALGAWPAIMITTGLHSFKHLVREPQEQFITIFVGIWFGVLALVTGSILAPLLIHCFTASFMDYAAIATGPGVVWRGHCDDGATDSI